MAETVNIVSTKGLDGFSEIITYLVLSRSPFREVTVFQEKSFYPSLLGSYVWGSAN